MIWYVRKTYQLSFENYIIKVFYNNIRPTCLKTGNHLSFKAHKLGPWFKNYTKNCFPRKIFPFIQDGVYYYSRQNIFPEKSGFLGEFFFLLKMAKL